MASEHHKFGRALKAPSLAILALSQVIWPAFGDSTKIDLETWQALNDKQWQAYEAGDYAAGLQWAKQAYEFANLKFGLKASKHSVQHQQPRQAV